MYVRLSSLTRDGNRLESLNRGTVKLASLAYCPAKEKWGKPRGSMPRLWLLGHGQTILIGSIDISSGAAEFRPTERLGMRLPRPVRIALLTILAITALAAPLVVWTERGLQSMFNAPLEWVPPTFEARRTFQEFVEQFGAHEMVLLSWPGCTVDDPRLKELETALVALREQRRAESRPEQFSRVFTGYSLLRTLMDEPLGLPREEAIRRLKGALVGPDGHASCAVVVLTTIGAAQRREVVRTILDAADKTVKIPRDRFRLAGPPIDGIAIDTESMRSIKYYAIPSAIVSFLLCWLVLRSLWMSLPILIVGVFGQGLMLALVYLRGTPMNAILIVLPPLVFVITVSAGVHMVNYFMDEFRSGPLEGATKRAFARGWRPSLLAAVTTAIGLGSLVVSDVTPVRHFGFLASLGVMVTVALLFLTLPGAMELWPRLPHWSGRIPAVFRPGRTAHHRERIWAMVATMVRRNVNGIVLSAVTLFIVGGIGLIWMRTSLNIVALLVPSNPVVRDFRWFEENIGPLIPVEVVVHIDRDGPLDLLARLELVNQVEKAMGEIDILSGAVSAATFLPELPQPGGLRATTQRTVIRRLVEASRGDLVARRYLHIGRQRESWRISARVQGKGDVHYGDFLERLRRHVEPVVEPYRRQDGGIAVTYTGITPVIYQVQEELLNDLYYSFLTALILVTAIMTVPLGSLRAGLVAMLPNALPMVVLFGGLGWIRFPVDIGTVMTASVALGLAVDGTFHFLTWFRDEFGRSRSRSLAVEMAFRHCGRALVQTAIICSLGLLVFGLSGFLPARNFSWMLMVLLLGSLASNLVLLPAILLSPLGSWFLRPGPMVRHASGHADDSRPTGRHATNAADPQTL